MTEIDQDAPAPWSSGQVAYGAWAVTDANGEWVGVFRYQSVAEWVMAARNRTQPVTCRQFQENAEVEEREGVERHERTES